MCPLFLRSHSPLKINTLPSALNRFLLMDLFIMAKSHVKAVLLLSKRSYAVAVEKVRLQPPPAAVKKAVGESAMSGNESTKQEGIFWMRDPKTGNWIPENHFGEVDAAELREKLLPKRQYL